MGTDPGLLMTGERKRGGGGESLALKTKMYLKILTTMPFTNTFA